MTSKTETPDGKRQRRVGDKWFDEEASKRHAKNSMIAYRSPWKEKRTRPSEDDNQTSCRKTRRTEKLVH